MDTKVEEITGDNGRTVEIHFDESPMNPRTDFDNATTMICFHKKYSLGDKHDYNSSDFNSWDELETRIVHDHKPTIILPLYMLDHSGITISTTDFHDIGSLCGGEIAIKNAI